MNIVETAEKKKEDANYEVTMSNQIFDFNFAKTLSSSVHDYDSKNMKILEESEKIWNDFLEMH